VSQFYSNSILIASKGAFRQDAVWCDVVTCGKWQQIQCRSVLSFWRLSVEPHPVWTH